tara:strand:+ start:318 stop:812 length:495 start_codon:yes stop_codon:yes gene_type:complete
MRVLGIDPGLQHCGVGVIEVQGSLYRHIAHDVLSTNPKSSLPQRLCDLEHRLTKFIALWQPDTAAVEETFVNKNALSSLKLGHARGIALLVPARAGLDVAEYPANLVKKTVVGAGHAQKDQMIMMVRTLLPGSQVERADAADALAVAICHANHVTTHKAIAKGR